MNDQIQPRCGRRRLDGQPCGTPVVRPGLHCAAHTETSALATVCASSVQCPKCRAQAGEDCHTRKAYHVARATRGLAVARRDEHQQHERAYRARRRAIGAARTGRRPEDADVTTGLACVCADCPLGEVIGWLAAIELAAVQ